MVSQANPNAAAEPVQNYGCDQGLPSKRPGRCESARMNTSEPDNCGDRNRLLGIVPRLKRRINLGLVELGTGTRGRS